MKRFKGKAIYCPSGKAEEYSYWACNFYVGCSNGCTYCYLKKGRGAKILGGDKPTLKTCFKDKTHALEVFEKEVKANLPELQKHGLFFSFTTDPMLPETQVLTMNAAGIAAKNHIPVKILTKCADWVDDFIQWLDNSNSDNAAKEWRKNYAFGFTLTGHDELEPCASTNQERIEAIKKLHDAGFRTFASIEPIIDFESSYKMILQCRSFCDLFKIGLMSGQKIDNSYIEELDSFVYDVDQIVRELGSKIYWKDSITKHINCDGKASVGRDYDMFNTMSGLIWPATEETIQRLEERIYGPFCKK